MKKNKKIKKTNDILYKLIENDLKENCKINIYNDGSHTHIDIEGNKLSILCNLAEAERGILKELNYTDSDFQKIKAVVYHNTKKGGN